MSEEEKKRNDATKDNHKTLILYLIMLLNDVQHIDTEIFGSLNMNCISCLEQCNQPQSTDQPHR